MSVRRLLSFICVSSILLLEGCAKSRPVAAPAAAEASAERGAARGVGAAGPVGVAAASAVARLQQELAAMFDNPSVNALWAVQVQSFDTGEVLFERNAHMLVMPASNM